MIGWQSNNRMMAVFGAAGHSSCRSRFVCCRGMVGIERFLSTPKHRCASWTMWQLSWRLRFTGRPGFDAEDYPHRVVIDLDAFDESANQLAPGRPVGGFQ